jgi:hypothetical protein
MCQLTAGALPATFKGQPPHVASWQAGNLRRRVVGAGGPKRIAKRYQLPPADGLSSTAMVVAGLGRLLYFRHYLRSHCESASLPDCQRQAGAGSATC